MTVTGAQPDAAAGSVAAAKPSLELLRELSDEHVLRALMTRDRMTRAELAAYTGISKPTVGESVRRLVMAGVPMRMPHGVRADLSPGMEFLLQAMLTCSKTASTRAPSSA